MSKDFYKILGVRKEASEDEIKKAFRRLAHDHHPDKGGDAAKFKDINEAYQVLSDKQKRAAYDRFGSAAFDGQASGGPGGFGGFGGFDFSGGGFQAHDFGDLGDVLGEMFGLGGMGGRTRAAHGPDMELEIELSFREAAFGLERDIRLMKTDACSVCAGQGAEPGSKMIRCETCGGSGQIRKTQHTLLGAFQTAKPCERCHGRGQRPEKNCQHCKGLGVERREHNIKLTIPPGMDTDGAIRIPGGGERPPHGGSPGDLFVRLRVKPDPHFTRDGQTVLSHVSLPYSSLVLGAAVDVETLDGKTSLRIPEGTRADTTFVLRGKGIPAMRGKQRGDHVVSVNVDIPKKLSKEQKIQLEKLREQGM